MITNIKYKDIQVGDHFNYSGETYVMSSLTKKFVVTDKAGKRMRSMEVHYAINVSTGEFLDPHKINESWLTLNNVDVQCVQMEN